VVISTLGIIRLARKEIRKKLDLGSNEKSGQQGKKSDLARKEISGWQGKK